MVRVLYPGSFDPITKGHMNIIYQASELFDEVVVAVMKNSLKSKGLFTLEERLDMIREIYHCVDNVKVIIGSGASVDVAVLENCKAIVRGLRGLTDFDFEMQLAQINRDISNNEVNTICLFASPDVMNISSSAVREVFSLGKDVSKYVDEVVNEKLLIKRRSL